MSSVHYKFKATLEYKTLTFDGLHIGVDELKKAICDKENIRTESFDLLLTNAHTKREYTAGELVPRNSSVVVQRIPRENAQKLPKVQDTSTSGIVQRSSVDQLHSIYIKPDEFAKMSEEQKLAHIKQVSTEKYSAANYQRRPTRIMEGPPPPTYVCNRCGQPGHWYKNCPLVNTRKTTGIPMDELMETTRDDPNAMLHPSGRFVKPIMHHQARLQRKHEPFPGQIDDGSGSPYTGEEQPNVPEQYKCKLCKGLLRDAVLAACCGHSFCAECYQQRLLANPMDCCPGADCSQQISADSLIPNKSLRATVQKYVNETLNGAEQTQMTELLLGANKPSVLMDTQSLLHKLMPDLAYAQAKRELATAGSSPTTTTATPPTRMIVSLGQTSSQSAIQMLHQQPYSQHGTVSSNKPMISTATETTSQLSTQPPKIPLFDPLKPPPPIPSSQSANKVTTPSTGLPTPPPIMTTGNATATAPTSPFSAEELTLVWENYLKRKDQETASKKAAEPSTAIILPGRQLSDHTISSQAHAPGSIQQPSGRLVTAEPNPPGDESQQPATPGIGPPGIGPDSSHFPNATATSGDNLSGALFHNAAHNAAIRALGPNAQPNEITEAWLSFLRMKDSSKRRYSISPQRRTPSPHQSDRYGRKAYHDRDFSRKSKQFHGGGEFRSPIRHDPKKRSHRDSGEREEAKKGRKRSRSRERSGKMEQREPEKRREHHHRNKEEDEEGQRKKQKSTEARKYDVERSRGEEGQTDQHYRQKEKGDDHGKWHKEKEEMHKMKHHRKSTDEEEGTHRKKIRKDKGEDRKERRKEEKAMKKLKEEEPEEQSKKDEEDEEKQIEEKMMVIKHTEEEEEKADDEEEKKMETSEVKMMLDNREERKEEAKEEKADDEKMEQVNEEKEGEKAEKRRPPNLEEEEENQLLVNVDDRAARFIYSFEETEEVLPVPEKRSSEEENGEREKKTRPSRSRLHRSHSSFDHSAPSMPTVVNQILSATIESSAARPSPEPANTSEKARSSFNEEDYHHDRRSDGSEKRKEHQKKTKKKDKKREHQKGGSSKKKNKHEKRVKNKSRRNDDEERNGSRKRRRHSRLRSTSGDHRRSASESEGTSPKKAKKAHHKKSKK